MENHFIVSSMSRIENVSNEAGEKKACWRLREEVKF